MNNSQMIWLSAGTVAGILFLAYIVSREKGSVVELDALGIVRLKISRT